MNNSITPKVSVITCFLNVELYIEETINSVLGQKYENWELILIDDGSTDTSSLTARKYAAEYPEKIIYLDHAGHINIGASASRNAGIAASTGDLIAFLDADDVWLPQYLANQVKVMQQQLVAMVCETTAYWFNWSGSSKEHVIIPVGAKGDTLYKPPHLMLQLYPLGKGAAPCICGIVVKKEILEKHLCFEESFKGMYDDQVLLSKIYMHEQVYVSASCFNLYRQQRPNSLVASSKGSAYHQVRLKFLKWFESYLKDNDISDTAVEKALKKALMPYRHPLLHFIQTTAKQRPGKILKKIFKPNRIKPWLG